MSSLKKFMIAMVAFMCGALSACATDSVPSTGPSVEVVRKSELDLRISANDGEAKVTIAVHRNGLREDGFIRDPEIDSPYDSDLIVRNRHQYPFLVSGNHGMPPDPDSGDMPEQPKMRFKNGEQIADLRLAVYVAEVAQSTAGIDDEFRWELRILRQMALNGLKDAEDSPVLSRVDEGADDVSSADEVSVAEFALSAPYTHTVSIRQGVCCNNLGNHSSVRLSVKDSSGTFVGAVSTKNHGREADDLSLSDAFNCPKSFGGRSVAFPNFQPYVNTDLGYLWPMTGVLDDAGGCHTPYGLTSGKHVCNDDSQTQYWNIKNNVSGTWAICADSTLNYWAPYCD